MRKYTYRFVWKDSVSKKYQRKFIEAASEGDAIADFEETFGITMDKDQVRVTRTYN